MKKDTWTRIDVVPGKRRDQSAVLEEGSRWVVSYPGFQVLINPATGVDAGIAVG